MPTWAHRPHSPAFSHVLFTTYHRSVHFGRGSLSFIMNTSVRLIRKRESRDWFLSMNLHNIRLCKKGFYMSLAWTTLDMSEFIIMQMGYIIKDLKTTQQGNGSDWYTCMWSLTPTHLLHSRGDAIFIPKCAEQLKMHVSVSGSYDVCVCKTLMRCIHIMNLITLQAYSVSFIRSLYKAENRHDKSNSSKDNLSWQLEKP